jgi:hypothetical protein
MALVLDLWSPGSLKWCTRKHTVYGLLSKSRRSPVWLRSCTLHIEMQGSIDSGGVVQGKT